MGFEFPPRVALFLHGIQGVVSGGSRGVPWVPRNPTFCRFAGMRRWPRARAQVQSKTFWTAEPPPFKILDLPLVVLDVVESFDYALALH